MNRDEVIADDRAYFERWPDREFRLRRAHSSEFTGDVPSAIRVFTIIHRMEVEEYWLHAMFPGPIDFEINLNDAEIRQLLAKIAAWESRRHARV